jgi:hypothetical protein
VKLLYSLISIVAFSAGCGREGITQFRSSNSLAMASEIGETSLVSGEPQYLLRHVRAKLVGSSLIIGGNEGGDITIGQEENGDFLILGDNHTVINSDIENVAQISVRGRRLNVIISLGNGESSVSFNQTNPIAIQGDLRIEGGKFSNLVTSTSFDPSSPLASLKVLGNLHIINRVTSLESVELTNINVRGDVQIRNAGSAGSNVTIDTGTIGGNILILNGVGELNSTRLSSVNVKKNLSVYNNAKETSTAINGLGVGGDVQVINGPGKSATTVISDTKVAKNLDVWGSGTGQNKLFLNLMEIKGNTKLSGTNGDNIIFVDSDKFVGQFQVKTGSGADNVKIGGSHSNISYTTTKMVPEYRERTVLKKNGVEMIEGYVLGNTATTTMEYDAGGPVTFHGKVTAQLGGGNDTVQLATYADVRFNKGATIDGEGHLNTAYIDVAHLPIAPVLKRFQVIPGAPPSGP